MFNKNRSKSTRFGHILRHQAKQFEILQGGIVQTVTATVS